MCYRLRKHEDSTGEISAKRPLVGKHLGQDGGIGGGSHRLEGVTSHKERDRPVKERVGSSARNFAMTMVARTTYMRLVLQFSEFSIQQ